MLQPRSPTLDMGSRDFESQTKAFSTSSAHREALCGPFVSEQLSARAGLRIVSRLGRRNHQDRLHRFFTCPAPHRHSMVGTFVDMAHVLVVEDDPTISVAIADRLRSEGFVVTIVNDGLVALATAERERPDLVLLDLTLPGLDGVEVCRRLHARTPVPVIMLTARDDESDMLIGLAVGADDYFTKPFSMRELSARIRTVLRRAERSSPTAALIEHRSLSIDVARRRVVDGRSGTEIELTPTEFELLVCLASHAGVVRTREQLLYDVWGYRDGSGARTVDSHIRSLRRKVGDDIVRTVHGVGYTLGDA